ncbi:hypothetical protein RI367_007727 [Sorochytrium milnesiophthora]
MGARFDSGWIVFTAVNGALLVAVLAYAACAVRRRRRRRFGVIKKARALNALQAPVVDMTAVPAPLPRAYRADSTTARPAVAVAAAAASQSPWDVADADSPDLSFPTSTLNRSARAKLSKNRLASFGSHFTCSSDEYWFGRWSSDGAGVQEDLELGQGSYRETRPSTTASSSDQASSGVVVVNKA